MNTLKWSDAGESYPNKWLLIEAIEAYSKDGQRVVEELSIINIFDEGKDALKEYSEKHKKEKNRGSILFKP